MSVLHVGDHVIVLNAYGALRRAVVTPVPNEWRDSGSNEATTTRGDFPKVWVKFPETHDVVPWPLADVFVDLALAQLRQEVWKARTA